MASVGSALDSFIQKIGNIHDMIMRLGTNYSTKSLINTTQIARVEPLTIISADCLNLEYTNDVLQSVLSIFSGYYLQAIALSTNLQNAHVIKALDRLNPDRHFNDLTYINESMDERHTTAISSYKFRLPTSTNKVAMESEMRMMTRSIVTTEFIDELNKVHLHDEEVKPNGASADKDFVTKTIPDLSNLAVGKLINIDIGVGEEKVTIPVNIRLATTTIPTESMVHLLALKKEDNTLVERFHSFRSGRISLIKDLIFCQDLIDEHKKALLNDESGVYKEILDRVNRSKKFGIISNNPSLVSASNIFVLSEVGAAELEKQLSGKLSNPRIRQKAFENTYAMIIVVVDRDWERVTFYQRGISGATEVSVKDLKASNKNKGPEIMDILKSLNAGSPAQF